MYNNNYSFKSIMSWTFHKRHRHKLWGHRSNKHPCIWAHHRAIPDLSQKKNTDLLISTITSLANLLFCNTVNSLELFFFFFFNSLLPSQNFLPFPFLIKTKSSGSCMVSTPTVSTSRSLCSDTSVFKVMWPLSKQEQKCGGKATPLYKKKLTDFPWGVYL